MPWTDPFSAIPGQLMTAALWNVQVRDNLNLLKTSIANDGRLNGELLTHRENVATIGSVGGVITIDLAVANVFVVGLTENISAINFINWTIGKTKTVTVRLQQMGAGNWTVVLPAGGFWLWSGGAVPVVTPTPGHLDILVVLSFDGTYFFPAMYSTDAH